MVYNCNRILLANDNNSYSTSFIFNSRLAVNPRDKVHTASVVNLQIYQNLKIKKLLAVTKEFISTEIQELKTDCGIICAQINMSDAHKNSDWKLI